MLLYPPALLEPSSSGTQPASMGQSGTWMELKMDDVSQLPSLLQTLLCSKGFILSGIINAMLQCDDIVTVAAI